MPYIDDIQQKRQEASELQEHKSAKDKLYSEINKSAQTVAKSVEKASQANQASLKQNLKVTVTNPETKVNNFPDLALRQDITELNKSIESLGTKLKPESVEFNPVIEQLKAISEKLDSLPKTFPEPIAPLENVSVSNLSVIEEGLNEIEKAVNKIEVSPVVKVNTPELNLEPIKKVIEELKQTTEATKNEISLKDFTAQDMDDENGSMQYVGFVSPNGNWYIIENDIEANSLRYKFGLKDYSKAWSKRVSTNYKLLNEAINEVRS